jgi:hypothetical protein
VGGQDKGKKGEGDRIRKRWERGREYGKEIIKALRQGKQRRGERIRLRRVKSNRNKRGKDRKRREMGTDRGKKGEGDRTKETRETD